MAASSSGARLPSPVKAMADSLPREDGDLLRYLASHEEGDYSGSSKAAKAQQQLGKKRHHNLSCGGVDHNVSPPGKRSSCSQFERYAKYWSRWSVSPNQRVIDDALELNDSLQAQATRKCPWSGGKKDKKPQKRVARDDGKNKVKASKGSDSSNVDLEKSSEVALEETIEQDKDKKSSRKPAEKKEEGVSKPPKSKQVAPLDLKEEDEDIEEAAAVVEVETRKPQSLGTKASEALGFLCEKLLRMWYPRLRRRS